MTTAFSAARALSCLALTLLAHTHLAAQTCSTGGIPDLTLNAMTPCLINGGTISGTVTIGSGSSADATLPVAFDPTYSETYRNVIHNTSSTGNVSIGRIVIPAGVSLALRDVYFLTPNTNNNYTAGEVVIFNGTPLASASVTPTASIGAVINGGTVTGRTFLSNFKMGTITEIVN